MNLGWKPFKITYHKYSNSIENSVEGGATDERVDNRIMVFLVKLFPPEIKIHGSQRFSILQIRKLGWGSEVLTGIQKQVL